MGRFSWTGALIVDPRAQESPTETEEYRSDKLYLCEQQRSQPPENYRALAPSPWANVAELPVREQPPIDFKFPFTQPRPGSEPSDWRTAPAKPKRRS